MSTTPPVPGPRYVLRYFFDAGSGTCLWAANDAARAAFGYAVDLRALPLAPDTRDGLTRLVQRFDGSIDWDDPGGASPWGTAARETFARAAAEGLARLRGDLSGHGFLVHDGPAPASC